MRTSVYRHLVLSACWSARPNSELQFNQHRDLLCSVLAFCKPSLDVLLWVCVRLHGFRLVANMQASLRFVVPSLSFLDLDLDEV